jgi:hypothetical protein
MIMLSLKHVGTELVWFCVSALYPHPLYVDCYSI